MIKKIKIFTNNSEKSLLVSEKLERLLQENHFEIVDSDFDLAIAIGGDGAFLNMVKSTQFNTEPYYIGINTGHLGFLQEVKEDHLEEFLDNLKAESYYVEEISVQKTLIKTDQTQDEYCSLNEIFVNAYDNDILKASLYIDDEKVESYIGDGLLVCTSVGSTAHNLSYQGAIVHHHLHTLQITTQGALNNSVYHTMPNSIIVPEQSEIRIVPLVDCITIRVDGEKYTYHHVYSVTTTVSKGKIKILRMKDYSLPKRIYEKFLV